MGVIRKVGIANSTSFWKDPWREVTPLRQKYPRLFAISNNKEASVEDYRHLDEEGGGWAFECCRPLFVWEEELRISLREDVEGHRWENYSDRWVWILEEDRFFSVKSCFVKLEKLLMGKVEWSIEELRVFETIWESKAPLKVVAFSWKLPLDRIPTRRNLARRNCLSLEMSSFLTLHFYIYGLGKSYEMGRFLLYYTSEFVCTLGMLE